MGVKFAVASLIFSSIAITAINASASHVLPLSTSSKLIYTSSSFQSGNPVKRLIRNLFENYNKEAVLDMPIVINMNILLLKVRNTIEKEGIFESGICLMIEWFDRRMMWNPEEYGNVTFISLGTDQVWLPDIAMINSADHLYSISRDARFTVRVSYDGVFKFVPTGTARSWCDLKLQTFPFDVQTCSLEFESWSLNSSAMTFDGQSELLIDSSFASTQFQLCEHKARTYFHTYDFNRETFTRVNFEFTFKRKSTFYVVNLIFPCATLSIIQLLVFLIPSTDTTADRIGFGTTNLLTLVVFQTIVTSELPKSEDVTALSKYIIALIIMSAVGIFESVIVERLMERTLKKPPEFVFNLLKRVPIILRERPTVRTLVRKKSLAFVGLAGLEPKENSPSSDSPQLVDLKTFLPTYTPMRDFPPITSDSAYNDYDSDLSFIDSMEKRRKESVAISGRKESIDNSPVSTVIVKKGNFLGGSQTPTFEQQRSFIQPEKLNKVSISSNSKPGDTDTSYWDVDAKTLWAEVVFKLDFLAFCFCGIIAVSVPCVMFLPLLYTESELCHK